MGSKGGDEPKESEYEEALTDIAKQLFAETTPMRGNLVKELTRLTAGKYQPMKSPLWAPTYSQAKTGIEDQYGVAKENILSNLPQGGTQLGQLGNLEISRASQMGELPAMISKDIVSDMLNKAYGTAFGAPQQSMSGLSSAAGSYGARQSAFMQSQAAENASKYGGLGSLVGLALGGPLGAVGGFAGKGGSTNPFE